ncbi:MBL fold metallo-hydrolase [Desulfoferrobacter suflitae]|uniref:MBL fold metallo-hydrolase n=1 Tax=Desulfoferrobacter suflitae TaxID=2865782 RepID=UPI0021646ABE|nr:MBL fold metallo-hydrolase [Desulfoferrobacter suflitae]MCK8602491.1 MBL fold metallo-hydrolase [Desulfoferrobacter suflitae]
MIQKSTLIVTIVCLLTAAVAARAEKEFAKDYISTSAGDLEIAFIGHGSLMFAFDGKIIHVDPVTREADYSTMPQADIILITHEHKDHYDPQAIRQLWREKTVLIANQAVAEEMKDALVMNNGDVKTVQGLKIEAVPAYNLVHMRSKDVPYHPRGNGNGYVITFADKRVYVAGDTENIPEMKKLEKIDIAFLPMNLPYTMSPQMVAAAAESFLPEILYPYHYGDTDTLEIVDLLKESEIEVRVRNMK